MIEIEDLARQACIIESHYQRPMGHLNGAKDGIDGKIYICFRLDPEKTVQQPETTPKGMGALQKT